MNNRIQEIDDFLKYVSRAKYVDDNIVYGLLTRYGLSNEEVEKKHRYLFDEWIDRYKNTNLNVYNSHIQPTFLQFKSNKTSNNHIKLYISLKEDALLDGVNKIFDFINANNMTTHSKVSEKNRSDEIVLRMSDPNDAKKVIDFINSDKYLVANARVTNPFLARDGIVGVAYDGHLSYNSYVSYLVSEYINFKRRKKDNNINVNDFSNYIDYFINYVYTNKETMEDFLSTSHVKHDIKRLGEEETGFIITNIKYVIELIKNNLSNNKLDNIINSFNKINDDNYINEEEYKYNLLLGINKELPEDIFNSYINYAYQKYNNVSSIIGYINTYLSGNINGITRDNNFRLRFKNNISSEIIYNITNGNLEEYITSYLGLNKRIILENALTLTYKKYGFDQLVKAINHGITGDFKSFTNDFNARVELRENFSIDEFKKYLEEIIIDSTLDLKEDFGTQVAREFVHKLENIKTL